MNKSLGDRMKDYEQRSRSYLQRRAYTVIRIDGKAFHTYTRGLEKPFDYDLVSDMVETTKFLCKNIQGCKLGYTQSDEISLVLTDFDTHQTDAYFDGQIQKICSVVASMATAKFNELREDRGVRENNEEWERGNTNSFYERTLAFFDARVFNLPNFDEVVNYLRWRQRDAVKNSISMVAQSLYSPKELHCKNGNEQQELIFQKGQNWNDFNPSVKRGTTSVRRSSKYFNEDRGETYDRTEWVSETPDFCKDEGITYLANEFPH